MSLKSFVVYKFTCAGCNARYIGETTRHLTTRIKEHLVSDKNSHIFKHINNSPNPLSKANASPDCFQIIDSDSSSFKLKIKEGFHINFEKPELNVQVKHFISSFY